MPGDKSLLQEVKAKSHKVGFGMIKKYAAVATIKILSGISKGTNRNY